MDRRKLALLGSVALMAAMVPAPIVAKSTLTGPFQEAGNYIVQMADEPVVAYTGTIKGLKATAPKAGTKIDPLSASVIAYRGYLNGKHTAALNATGGRKLYDYDYSFNGFSAALTAEQANRLAKTAGVLSVSPDQMVSVDTSSTPTFLGLTDEGGLWDQLGGTKNAGEGIIIGDIDSGIWPESLSFTDRVDKNGVPSSSPSAKLAYQQIPGWHGKCTPGEAFNASMCNEKLIGAQWFNASWGGDKAIDAQMPWEFTSVRDYNGHGTHTASTAGGNNNVPTTGPAAVFGPVSGMAPRARIAMYKALWSTQDASTANGYNADLVAAIDQAVADGVDVINFSISGTLTNFADPVEISFMYAARAGIFVSESAGNSGPASSTVAHPSPWTTTVAAGTHNRSAIGTVTLGNGAVYTGPSTSPKAVTAALISATDAGLPGADATKVRLCYSSLDGGNVLDPAKVAGKIVVCDRGTTARVNKSLAVLEAGGVGMVLINPSAGMGLNADFHSVPSVHLDSDAYAPVHAYAATAGATATISKATIDYSTPAPDVASFSSRGPLLAGGGDVLKPDVIAPGQDILAAVSPASGGGLSFNLYSGTSMSSPHVAGVAALLKQQHPSWTPMEIKSALMTSAYDLVNNDPQTAAEAGLDPTARMIFRQGAGHIQPNSAADPGLAFNAGWNDWLAFLCGGTTAVGPTTCTTLKSMGYSTNLSDYNGASVAIGSLAGSQTVTRTVTNVSAKAETYAFSSTNPGLSVEVTPASFTVLPGKTQTLKIKITNVSATLNAYAGGQLTWSGNQGHVVRIPLVAKPVALAAPAQVTSAGAAIEYPVTFGYTGDFTATARGLVPATTFSGSISTGDAQYYTVTVPAGSTYARFSLFDENVSPASDLDLVVYRCTDPSCTSGTTAGSSGGGTSAEEVNLLNPTAATYLVEVDGYATANPSAYTLFTWVLGSADAGNMTVTAPATGTLGTTGTISLAFSGLTAGTKYLGSVVYSGAAGMPNPTIVRVDP